MSLPEGNDKEGWFRLGWLQISVGHFDVAKWLKDINLRNDYSRNTQLDGREGSILEVTMGRRGQEGCRRTKDTCTSTTLKDYIHSMYVSCIGLQGIARDILYAHVQASSAYLRMYVHHDQTMT